MGGGQHSLLGLTMQPVTYRTLAEHDFQRPDRPPQADPVTANAAESKVPKYMQPHVDQVYQWRQMVNV